MLFYVVEVIVLGLIVVKQCVVDINEKTTLLIDVITYALRH